MKRSDFLKKMSFGAVATAAVGPLVIKAVKTPDPSDLEWIYDCPCSASVEFRKIGCKPRCMHIADRIHYTFLYHPEIGRVIQYPPFSLNPFTGE